MGFLTIGNIIFGSPIKADKHIDDSVYFVKKLNLDFTFYYGFDYLKESQILEEAYRSGKITLFI